MIRTLIHCGSLARGPRLESVTETSLPKMARGCRNVVLQQVGSYLGYRGVALTHSGRQTVTQSGCRAPPKNISCDQLGDLPLIGPRRLHFHSLNFLNLAGGGQ